MAIFNCYVSSPEGNQRIQINPNNLLRKASHLHPKNRNSKHQATSASWSWWSPSPLPSEIAISSAAHRASAAPLGPASRAPGWSARCDPAPRTWAVRPSPHILPLGGRGCRWGGRGCRAMWQPLEGGGQIKDLSDWFEWLSKSEDSPMNSLK